MAAPVSNMLAGMPHQLADELSEPLVITPHLRIERVVSTGQASPPGFWYDQDWAEWVLVLSGAAGLEFEGEAAPRALGAGDCVLIPAHARHRVAWTDAAGPTVWLAVHYAEP